MFSKEELEILNKAYNKNAYPKKDEFEKLAKKMKYPLHKIQVRGCYTTRIYKIFRGGFIENEAKSR